MPIDTEGLEHGRECPECKGALIESVGYNLCPHCGHRLNEKTASPGRKWICPDCGVTNSESMNPGGRGVGWHDCPNCGYQESSPRDFDYADMESQYPEDAPHDQLDDLHNGPHFAKFQIVSMGEMQQPGGVGATQTTGLTDGEGIQHPDDHSEMADAGHNSFEQNVALETWVNFAVDMLNRGKRQEEVQAQLAHDGCPEPDAVIKRALEQPQQDPVGNAGAQDPFEIPYQSDEPGGMESVHNQPPVLSHWLETPEDKPAAGQQVRIANTSWRGIELDRWEDLYGQKMARVALNDGGIITVAAEVVEADGERKIADPATEIQSFIDGLPEVEPTRPSIIARIANLKLARSAVHSNISKVGFSDQVKLERLDRRSQDEIRELMDFLGRLASDSDQQYVREQQRYRQAGQHNRERVTNAEFNARIAETAAIFVQELAPETRADPEQTVYAAAHFASQHNGDVGAFVAAVKKATDWSDGKWRDDRSNDRKRQEWEAIHGTPDEQRDEQIETGMNDPHRDPEMADYMAYGIEGEPDLPGGPYDHDLERLRGPILPVDDPGADDPQLRGGGPIPPVNDLYPDNDLSDEGGMSDEEYWRAREHGEHPDHNPEEDPFAIWPNGHPMDH